MDPQDRWGLGEGWSEVAALIELARQSEPKWSAAKKERLFRQVLARIDEDRKPRRLRRALATGAAALVLLGVLVGVTGGGLSWFGPGTGDASELAHANKDDGARAQKR